MNQSQLFYSWAKGELTGPATVGTVWANPYRLFYGPSGASLALCHNNMVLVSGVQRSGHLKKAVINTHRRKLYQVCRANGIEFNHGLPNMRDLRRSGHMSSLMIVRHHIESLVAGGSPDPFPVHETYGYTMTKDYDSRIMERYLFICQMLGFPPIHDDINDMIEWHRCVSMLAPSTPNT